MKRLKSDTIKIGTYLDQRTEIIGDVNIKSSVKVDGNITGNLICTDDIVIGEKCLITGNVSGKDIIVNGCIKGNVLATETVTLTNKGKIEGDVAGTGFIVDIGSQYSGRCTIIDKKCAAAALVDMQKTEEPQKPAVNKPLLTKRPEAPNTITVKETVAE